MDSRSEHSGVEPSPGTTSSTWEQQGEASEPWPIGWRHTDGELPALDRLELLGWDEV